VPFGDGDPPAVLYRVIYAPPELSAVPAGLRDLVAACLVKNPAERLTLPQVLRACAAAESAGRAGDRSVSASFWPGPVAALIARYEAGLTGQVASLEPAAGEPTGGVDGSLGARLRSRPAGQASSARAPGHPRGRRRARRVPSRPPGRRTPSGRPPGQAEGPASSAAAGR
jgi:hypothetical protein